MLFKFNLIFSYPLFKVDDLAVTLAMNSDMIDINLPFDRPNEMLQFASNDDGLLEKRKEALVRRIYSSCDLSSPQSLKETLCQNLFTKQCMQKN